MDLYFGLEISEVTSSCGKRRPVGYEFTDSFDVSARSLSSSALPIEKG